MASSSSVSALYQQVAFAPWGSTVRPIVVLNPHTDVPEYIREQWAAFPDSQELQICCWIGGDITFLPRRKIIDYDLGVAEGYNEKPLSRKSTLRPLVDSVERDTQMAMEMMGPILADSPENRVQTVTQRLSFYHAAY